VTISSLYPKGGGRYFSGTTDGGETVVILRGFLTVMQELLSHVVVESGSCVVDCFVSKPNESVPPPVSAISTRAGLIGC
jgi:hypothetical protein